MVPYAGQELRYCPRVRRSYRALMMFRAGKDTVFIANYLGHPETRILRWITEERSRELGLSNPYLSPSKGV